MSVKQALADARCRITEKSNYNFLHVDMRDDRYNPKGKIPAASWALPFDTESFDGVSLVSVFTRRYENEMRKYLEEIQRVLKVGGKCVSTFFLFEENRLPVITGASHGLRMQCELNSHTRYHSEKDKLHAMRFEKDHIEAPVKSLEFREVAVSYGRWAGGAGIFQDGVVLTK